VRQLVQQLVAPPFGAIAGGGKGVAIGAIVSTGSGVGSVYVQGRDNR
jgi:hypothetical protein